MEIPLVDKGDLNRRAGKRLGGIKSAESTADYHNAMALVLLVRTAHIRRPSSVTKDGLPFINPDSAKRFSTGLLLGHTFEFVIGENSDLNTAIGLFPVSGGVVGHRLSLAVPHDGESGWVDLARRHEI